jgi:peroxiredoxin
LADYREHYAEIRSAGANVVAVSVDAPDQSAALRVQLSLPFAILCDTEHRVVREWGVYNSGEKGGIAEPAVFIVDARGVVRYAAVGTVARRVSAAEIVGVLRNADEVVPIRWRVYVPMLSDWVRGIRNYIKR